MQKKHLLKKGNTRIYIHSPLVVMSREDRSNWFKKNKDINPYLVRLREILWEEVRKDEMVQEG